MIETPLVMVKISHEQRRFTTRQVGAEASPEERGWHQLNSALWVMNDTIIISSISIFTLQYVSTYCIYSI
jgi:hypothetical protein